MNENRSHRLEILIGTLATGLIVLALGLYILLEPGRIQAADQTMLTAQLDDSMTLYAENCSVCHGLQGEGIGSTLPLNNPALRTMDADTLFKTIARGRFNTAMPAWSKEDGGPLSDYQINELVLFVQNADWNTTKDRVVNLGMAPLIPFTTQPDPAILAQVGLLSGGATLQAALTIYADKCVACHGADGLGTKIALPLNDPKPRAKTSEELIRTITFGNAGTLMAGWDKKLSTSEIATMVTLIQRWDEIPTGAIPAPDVPIPTTVQSLARGQEIFTSTCSRCHGPSGQGTPRAPALNVKSVLTKTTDLQLEQIITAGVPGTAMPAWGDRLPASDIQAVVGFIRQWEATAPEVASPVRGGGGGPAWRQAATQTTASLLDWRVLLLVTLVLAAAFSLISIGYEKINKLSPKKQSESIK